MIGLQNGNDPKVENLECYKMLISAIVERAVKDYKRFDYRKGEKLKDKHLSEEEIDKLNNREQGYLSAVSFFNSPDYEYFSEILGFRLTGQELMAELDRRKLKRLKKKVVQQAV